MSQAHAPYNGGFSVYFLVVETQKKERGMRFTPSIFGKLFEAINRRQFQASVDRHAADAYDKSFKSWDHLVTLVFAQLSGATSLRSVEAIWNANSQHHYHIGSGKLMRSTLSDANKRRPVEVFAETFLLLAGQLDRLTRREGSAMLRLIDSTPIPLGKLCNWAKSNGRIRGMKMHVVYDPKADRPHILDITNANVNDAQIGRTVEIEKGAAYVFDKGYCHYAWWRAIAAAGSIFVTRPKANMGLKLARKRRLGKTRGDDFTILDDSEVSFASKGDSKLPIRLRRVRLQRQEGGIITLLTNDLKRSAVEIGALYKGRWQIELLFRWIKQHLNIRKFIGINDNAIRLQIFAAMIAYALLRIAVRAHRLAISILRFADLVSQCLFERRRIEAIEKPPPVNPSIRKNRTSPDQMAFNYA
jgi:putative transposase